MGHDAAIAVLSERPRLVYDYFTQLFAQVTNPPLDAIREELVTSARSKLGPEGNVLRPTPEFVPPDHPAVPGHRQRRPGQAGLRQRARRDAGLRGVRHRRAVRPRRRRRGARRGHRGRAPPGEHRHRRWGRTSSSSRTATPTQRLAPMPSLLLTAAVHEHLVREKTRTSVGLVVETGDAREVHHIALLIGYGATAVNPYLAFETIDDMIATGMLEGMTPRQARRELHQGVVQGRDQDHVEDGGLHRGVVHGGPDLRGRRARRGTSSTSTSPAR